MALLEEDFKIGGGVEDEEEEETDLLVVHLSSSDSQISTSSESWMFS